MKNNLIRNNDTVRVKVVRNEVILHNINTCNRRATIKRIGGGRHINVRTGEIVEETRQVKRGDSMYSLIESNLKLQDIIKENTINTDHILFITLTYAEKIFDIKKAGFMRPASDFFHMQLSNSRMLVYRLHILKYDNTNFT